MTGVSERWLQDYVNEKYKKTKKKSLFLRKAKDVFNCLSQFFQSILHFSSHPKERSTTLEEE